MTKHKIVHVEFSAKDAKAAGNFYSTLFGWKTEYLEEAKYTIFDSGDDGVGGGLPELGELTKAGDVMVFVSTDDIDASLAKAESLGGKIMVPKTEIPMTGWFGRFSDPTGNIIGLYTPLPSAD